jgi:hypothetical protein
VNETTAQDASGATIVPWNDLKVAVFSPVTRSSARVARLESTLATGRMTEPRTGKEAVDAAGPVDAQNAPTGPWKTADGFPRAPTAIIGS